MTRVLVAATTTAARAALEALVRARPGLELVPSAPGLNLLQQIEEAQPDVLLMDLERESLRAALAGLVLRAQEIAAVVALIPASGGPRTLELLSAGARAVLPHDATAAEIAAAIDAAASGLVALHPEAARALQPAAEPDALAHPRGGIQPLTAREMEVLAMMADGLGNKIIASRLHISEHTVKFHITSIFAKLGAERRTEAVTIGIRHGLIPL